VRNVLPERLSTSAPAACTDYGSFKRLQPPPPPPHRRRPSQNIQKLSAVRPAAAGIRRVKRKDGDTLTARYYTRITF